MKRHVFLLLCVTLLGFSIRFYKLTSSPSGLYIDETSIGYNAYSLLKTGRDEHGRSWPLFFEAFGEWKLPVYIYSVFITQLFLGPTNASIRLPAVLCGTVTIPLIYLWLQELLKDSQHKGLTAITPVIGAVLLAVSPWHFQFTHAGFEASSGLFFLVLGLLLFQKAASQQSGVRLMGSLVSFGLSLYSYNSARIVVPVVGVCLGMLYMRRFIWWKWGISVLVCTLLLVPFIRFSLSPAGWARFQQVGIFYQHDSVINLWQTFLTNYGKNISPETVFIKGEPTIAHLTPHRMNLVYPIELPFMLLGITYAIRYFRRAFIVPGILLVVGFVPPAVTTLNPHALRAFLVLPAIIYFSALGTGFVWEKLWGKLRIVFGGVYFLVIVWLCLKFLTTYHLLYTRDAGSDWQVDIYQSSEAIKKYEKDYSHVYIEAFGAARTAFAWYLKIDPSAYQMAKNKNQTGKYTFEIHPADVPLFSRPALIVSKQNQMPPGRLIETMYYPNGTEAYYVFSI